MADVQNSLRAWSPTAGNNRPTQATTIGSGLSDNLQQIQAVIRQFLASYGTPIASAASMDLTTMDGFFASVTGNTTVTGLGTEAAGISYWLSFASTPMFKNSASLILGGADITFAAGDIAQFTSEGSGVSRMTAFFPTGGVTGTGGLVRSVSPTFTGTPAAPTAAAGTSTTQLATTAFVSGISAPTVQRYTSTGANSWAKPANLKYIIVECVGGGGAGGNTVIGAGGQSSGGGGGGGGYVRKLITAASVAASVTATVGASGGLSAFQGHCTATAGSAGSNGGADTAGAGGSGGVGLNGDVNAGGGLGQNGVTGSGNVYLSGHGGNSIWGMGAQGFLSSLNTNGGTASIGFGGGGSGGSTSAADKIGGSGAPGVVVVTEYYA